MSDVIELTPDEIAFLRRASAGPVRSRDQSVRQLCINLEGRQLMQRWTGGMRTRVGGGGFVLTPRGWRRLKEDEALRRRRRWGAAGR